MTSIKDTEAWNAVNAVGTKVTVDNTYEATTGSLAWVIAGVAVISLVGHTAAYKLERVKAV